MGVSSGQRKWPLSRGESKAGIHCMYDILGFLYDKEVLFLYVHYQPVNTHCHSGIMIHSVWM